MIDDDFYRASQEKRKRYFDERYKKDKAFKRHFYRKLDEMLQCQTLMELKPGIEWLIFYCEQIDGKDIFQPMRGFLLYDLEAMLYGLQHWTRIRSLIYAHGSIKQVDIISELGLDKDRAGFFLYTFDRMGVIEKSKQGRYNVYVYVSERISEDKLRQSWWLFDETKRLPIE